LKIEDQIATEEPTQKKLYQKRIRLFVFHYELVFHFIILTQPVPNNDQTEYNDLQQQGYIYSHVINAVQHDTLPYETNGKR